MSTFFLLVCYFHFGFIKFVLSQQTVQLFFDELSTNDNNWDYNGDVVIPSDSASCSFVTSCFEVRNGWVERTFSTKGHKDVQISFYVHGDSSGTLSVYVYDSYRIISSLLQPFGPDDASFTLTPTTASDWDNIETFKVRFQIFGSVAAYLDTFQIWAVTHSFAPSPSPTLMPTQNPSRAPTENTNLPSFYPTSQPTMIPTNVPTSNPSASPTEVPTNAAMENEGNAIENVSDQIETTNDENEKDKSMDSIFSDQNILENQYYLYVIAAVFLCLICAIIICCLSLYKMKKEVNEENDDNLRHERVKTMSNASNVNAEDVEMLSMSSTEMQTPTTGPMTPTTPSHNAMNSLHSINLSRMTRGASDVDKQMVSEGHVQGNDDDEGSEENENEDNEDFYALPNETMTPEADDIDTNGNTTKG